MIVLLPDTKDLIDLIETSQPVSANEFTGWLRNHQAKVALTFTNVSEFADTLRETHDVLYVRSILQRLEALPSVFLREVTIEVDEIERAIDAFDEGREPTHLNPFVERWDRTFAKRGEPPPPQMIVNYRLDLMVFDLRGEDPQRIARKREALQAIHNDRAVPRDQRPTPRKSIAKALANKIAFWGLRTPNHGVDAFAKWIFADPSRCPGFRLAWELFHALVSNETDALQESDVSDMAHFPAIPYVGYATLDRRMTGYLRAISQRLTSMNPVADYRKRVLPNLAGLMSAIDSNGA